MASFTRMKIFLYLFCLNSIFIRGQLYVGTDGGYQNVAVTISNDVKEESLLVSKIENIFRNLSKELFEATNHHFYIASVNIITPSWYLPQKTNTLWIDSAPFLIENEAHGSNLYTIQGGSCGYPGLFVRISKNYILDNSNSVETKAKALVHQWGHLRFGVYDDHGYVNDTLYPMSYEDIKLRYENETSSVEDNYYLKYNDNSENSVMSSFDGKEKDTKFCGLDDKAPHKVEIPTKQNFLCNHRSSWDVIKNTHDFNEQNNNRILPETTFHTFKNMENAKATLVVDMAEDLDFQKKGYLIKESIKRISKLTSLDNINAILQEKIYFGNTSKSPTDWRRQLEDSMGKFNESVLIDAIETAFNNSLDSVILIMRGNVSDATVDEIRRIMKDKPSIKLHLIILHVENYKLPKLTDKIYFIGKGSLLELLIEFEKSFISILNGLISKNRLAMKVLKIEEPRLAQLDIPKIVTKAHMFIDTLSSSRNFIVNHGGLNLNYNFSKVTNRVSVAEGLQTFKDGIDVNSKKTGLWNFDSKINDSAVTLIYTLPDDFRLSFWSNLVQKPSDENTNPLTIYTYVAANSNPIGNLVITAKLINLKTRVEHHVRLNDNGDTQPDITEADGIYSGSLMESIDEYSAFKVNLEIESTNASTGMSSKVLRDCCGSKFESLHFNDYKIWLSNWYVGGLFIEKHIDSTKFLPKRILDLKAYNKSESTFLQWTHVGANITVYEIQFSINNRTDLFNDYKTQAMNPIKPRAGELLEYEFQVPFDSLEEGVNVFFISVVSVNEFNVKSWSSNVVLVEYDFYRTEATTTTTQRTHTATNYSTETVGSTNSSIYSDKKNPEPPTNKKTLFIAVGSVCGVIVILIFVIIVALLIKKQKKSKNIVKPDCSKIESTYDNSMYEEIRVNDRFSEGGSPEIRKDITDTKSVNSNDVPIYAKALPKSQRNAKQNISMNNTKTENDNNLPEYAKVLPKIQRNLKKENPDINNENDIYGPEYAKILPKNQNNLKNKNMGVDNPALKSDNSDNMMSSYF